MAEAIAGILFLCGAVMVCGIVIQFRALEKAGYTDKGENDGDSA